MGGVRCHLVLGSQTAHLQNGPVHFHVSCSGYCPHVPGFVSILHQKTFAKAIDVLQAAAINPETRTGEMDGPCPEMSSVCGNLKDWCHKNPAIDHICTTTCNSCYNQQ